MHKDTTMTTGRASRCALGEYLRRHCFFAPLREQVQIPQKMVRYRPIEKVLDGLLGILCGAKTISQSNGTSNRSGCQNLTLAIKTLPVVPPGYGNASRITARALGTDPTQSTSLYSGTRSAGGDFRRHDGGVARPAEPDLAALFTPTIKRPAPKRAATPSSEYPPSWWSTGPSWPYPTPCACGRSR